MRRSSFIQLTLLPMLASARLVHADPAPPATPVQGPAQDPQAQACYDANGNQVDPVYGQTYYDGQTYYNTTDGPVQCAVLMPPGMTPVEPEVPCDVDPDQPRCVPLAPDYYYYGGGGAVYRGGFGGYFHGGGGGHGGGVGG